MKRSSRLVIGSNSKVVTAAALIAAGAVACSSVALANIARHAPSPDGIIGAWVGQAAQPNDDPFDVRLTFVSPRGGVSRYPGDPACGGVLVGREDGNQYEYEETITYGAAEDVTNGCLNGKLKLTVDGDTMKLDWTSTNAEGEQLTSSGELHREGSARKR